MSIMMKTPQQSPPPEILHSLVHELSFWEDPAAATAAAPTTTTAAAAPSIVGTPGKATSTIDKINQNLDRQLVEDQRDDEHVSSTCAEAPVPSSSSTWKTATDPASGRTYYYDSVTRKTQWEKPAELRNLEKQKKREQRERDVAFFRQMEANLLASRARGEVIPGSTVVEPQGPPQEPVNGTSPGAASRHLNPGPKVRTISAMDEHMLAELHKASTPMNAVSMLRNAHTQLEGRATIGGVSGGSGGGGLIRGRPPLPRVGSSSLRNTNSAAAAAAAAAAIDEQVTQMMDQLDMELSPELQQHYRHALAEDSLHGEHLLDVLMKEGGGDGGGGGGAADGANSSALTTAASTGNAATLNNEAAEHPQVGLVKNDSTGTPASLVATAATNNAHVRRNTGSTIHVSHTMENPDIEATIRCVCGVYRSHIDEAAHRHPSNVVRSPLVHVNFNVFRDNVNNTASTTATATAAAVPTLDELTHFYKEFFERSQMEFDTIIMSLIYAERLIKETHGALTPAPHNWRSILLSCMMLSSKVFDDLSMWNIDFSNVASGLLAPFSLARINELERTVLTCLGFNVRIGASEYAKYYFLIRAMLMRSGLLDEIECQFTMAPSEPTRGSSSITANKKSPTSPHDTRHGGMADRRAHSVDWSAGGNPQQGPVQVMVKKDCLEQLVKMDR